MNTQRIVQAAAGIMGVICLGVGSAQAATATSIPPSSMTLEIQSDAGAALQENQFPNPGQILKLVLKNGGVTQTITSLSLQNTTTYRGSCTNFGSPSDTGPDFVPVSGQVDRIQSTDCGGTTQVVANGFVFNLINDSDADGLPDWYELQYCGTNATCLSATADVEQIGANTNVGDGFVNIDEYRGFIVSGVPIRTNPLRKDLFVHLVNPEGACARNAATTLPALPPENSFLGTNSTSPTELAKVFPTDGAGLFATVNFSGVDMHFLNFVNRGINNAPETEWVDNLSGLTGPSKDQRVYLALTDGAVSDRRVNLNTLDPGNPTRKGIRMIECLDESVNSPVGLATFPVGVQVGTPSEDTNSIIYTQRIYKDFANLLTRASTKGLTSAYQSCALAGTCVWYRTYTHNGTTVTPTTATKVYTPAAGFTCPGGATPPCPVKRDYITSKYIQYVNAMELGHSVSLIPVLQITQYGPHYVEGSGDNLDQRVVAKDSKTLAGVLFSIPSSYGYKSNDCFKLRSGAETPAASCQP